MEQNKNKSTKKKMVHGVGMTNLEIMIFNKWCDKNNVAMNTLTEGQRKEVAEMFLRAIPK